MNSALYVGHVMHRRIRPVKHQFLYRLYMPCIDLDELTTLKNRIRGFGTQWWQPARFKRSDYLGEGDLKQAVFNKLYELTGERLEGRVMLLCQLRYFGLYFSPVNFYYCFDQDEQWRYLLAEVSNTPWNERHYYAIPAQDNWQHDKAFHVSPFNPMDQHYQWQLKPLGETAQLCIQVHRQNKEFEAGIHFNRQRFNGKNLLKLMIKMPLMPVSIVWGIYSHAFKLWRKKAPFYSHPDQSTVTSERSQHVSE
jgi:DUF1365 family protein